MGDPRTPAGEAALRLLGSGQPLDDDELHRLYGYPADPQRPWVRANFISSADGGANVAGATAGLGGPGDRALFALLRSLADIVVVGAGTVRIEKYGGVRLSVAERQRRQSRGQAEVPRLAIVTRSGLLDRDMGVFTATEVPPLILTCRSSAEATRHRLAGVVDPADVRDCSAGDPDAVDVAAALTVAGAGDRHRVLTEGGPTLLGSFIEAGLLDELCLTVAPFLVGGASPRIAAGAGQRQTPMHCAHLLTDEAGYLYARYVRSVR
ncbi:MAG TPA: pyrimidine reductase family protein [Mycobacterium sp.]|nr:pyrimidine reductase family protein [Mycobacterium sp.]